MLGLTNVLKGGHQPSRILYIGTAWRSGRSTAYRRSGRWPSKYWQGEVHEQNERSASNIHSKRRRQTLHARWAGRRTYRAPNRGGKVKLWLRKRAAAASGTIRKMAGFGSYAPNNSECEHELAQMNSIRLRRGSSGRRRCDDRVIHPFFDVPSATVVGSQHGDTTPHRLWTTTCPPITVQRAAALAD